MIDNNQANGELPTVFDPAAYIADLRRSLSHSREMLRSHEG